MFPVYLLHKYSSKSSERASLFAVAGGDRSFHGRRRDAVGRHGDGSDGDGNLVDRRRGHGSLVDRRRSNGGGVDRRRSLVGRQRSLVDGGRVFGLFQRFQHWTTESHSWLLSTALLIGQIKISNLNIRVSEIVWNVELERSCLRVGNFLFAKKKDLASPGKGGTSSVKFDSCHSFWNLDFGVWTSQELCGRLTHLLLSFAAFGVSVGRGRRRSVDRGRRVDGGSVGLQALQLFYRNQQKKTLEMEISKKRFNQPPKWNSQIIRWELNSLYLFFTMNRWMKNERSMAYFQ